MNKKKILVIDDNRDILDFITEYLSDYEFTIYTAEYRAMALSILQEHSVDLLLVDLRLESESGLELARDLTQRLGVPAIIVSAITDDLEKIVSLESVVDDYIEKPVNPRLMLARIRAVLRRHQTDSNLSDKNVVKHTDQRLSFGQFYLDADKRLLINDETGIVELTNTEYRLLELFVTKPNNVLSRESIVEQLDIESSSHLLRNIDVLVLRLRRKIESRPSMPKYLQTRRNKGYVFCLD